MDDVKEEVVSWEEPLIRFSVKNLLSATVSASLISLLLVLLVWENSDFAALVVWLVFMVMANIGRYIDIKLYVKRIRNWNQNNFKVHYFVGLLVTTFLWAYFILYFFPKEPHLELFVIILYAGIASGAAISLAAYRLFSVSFFLLFLMPLIIALYQFGDYFHQITALGILFYMFAMMYMSWHIRSLLVRIFKSNALLFKSQEELEHSRQHIKKIFEQTPIGIFSFDKDLNITECNYGLANIMESTVDKIKTLNLRDLHNQILFAKHIENIFKGETVFYQGPYKSLLSGKELWIEVKASPIRSVSGAIEGGLVTLMDISDKKLDHDKIEFLAYHDELTALPNRNFLCERLDEQLLTLKRIKRYTSMIFIDLDHFKTINDSLGHHVGDELLKMFVERISVLLNSEDVFSRLGGDEFILFLGERFENPIACISHAMEIASKIHTKLSKSMNVYEHKLHLTASIGVALIDYHLDDKHDVLKHADLAMYKAKEEGRNRTCLYKEEMDEKIKRRLMVENELHYALKEEGLELFYQPIVSSKNKRMVCVEALLRYRNKEGTLIYPDKFISVAEESGLIIQVGYWIIEEACKSYYALKRTHADMTLENIAVNISPKQFMQDDFIARIREIIDSYRLSYNLFELELTESVFIRDVDVAISKMYELKAFGFLLSMDDFGTGYSSLSYLRKMPFDLIKIDKSFIDTIVESEADKKMLFTIVDICKTYGKRVIAEGIESKEQALILDQTGCDYYQGYRYAKPMTREDLEIYMYE